MLCCFAILVSYVAVFMIGLCFGTTKWVESRFRLIWYICIYPIVAGYVILHWSDFIQDGASIGNVTLFAFFLALTALPFLEKFKFGQVEGSVCSPFKALTAKKQEMDSVPKTPSANMAQARKDQEKFIKEINKVMQHV